ncbi:MAG: glycosyltransferase family 2 protein [Limnochordia bacterium]|jgi:glycosyltransferase involved in cell wall biosynthesis
MSIGVVIPAWNEAGRIVSTLLAVQSIPLVDEVWVIDDGSTDSTASEARAAGARVVSLERNQGKGRALQVGVHVCPTEIIMVLDADLEHSAVEAAALLPPVLNGEADMTIARFPRQKPAGLGLVRGLARWGIRKLTGLTMESPLSGQRAARKDVFTSVRFAEGWGIEVALTIDAARRGYRIKEIPVNMTHRETHRDWQGFVHRGRQFVAVGRELVPRLLWRGGPEWSSRG